MEEGEEFVFGFVDARSIDENHLIFICGQYAVYLIPGGLRLGRNYGNFFAYKGVHQTGFSHVGTPEYAYKTRFQFSLLSLCSACLK